jgi:type I restriction enzyme M protein
LWFLSRNRKGSSPSGGSGEGGFRNRTGEILFIDARNLGELINRRTKVLNESDIAQITGTYHNWRNPDGNYEDIAGFCASAPIKKVKELDYVLTPGRYVGLADDEDDFDFNERFAQLKAEFEAQLQEESILNKQITENLLKIKLNVEK